MTYDEPMIVEIDESYFFHRKYNKSRYRKGQWVFGAIERDTGFCFLQVVKDRTQETLEELIQKWILPGSIIMSDGWAYYANIENIDDGIYLHEVILHKNNFVDPNDTRIHTQNIENTWMRTKAKLRRQYGTNKEKFSSYLIEHIEDNFFTILIIIFQNMIISISLLMNI